MKLSHRFLGMVLTMFAGSVALAEVKTELVVRKTSIVTQDDAKVLIKLLKKGSNSLRFEGKDPWVSIQCSEDGKEKCTIVAERAGLKAENAKALTAALGGKSYSSQDGKLSLYCGVAVVFPSNDSQEPRRDVPFCNISQY